MVPFKCLAILAACLVIGGFCDGLQATPSDAKQTLSDNTPVKAETPSVAATRRHAPSSYAVCDEITASELCRGILNSQCGDHLCSWIIHENNSNTINVTILSALRHDRDSYDDMRSRYPMALPASIEYSTTQHEDKKCSFKITIPLRSEETDESHRANNYNHPPQMSLTNFFYCPGNKAAELHSCTEVKTNTCNDAPAIGVTTKLRSTECSCFVSFVSPTNSSSTSTLAESTSTASSTTKSQDKEKSSSVSTTSSSASHQTSAVHTTTAAAAKTSSTTYKTSTGTASSDKSSRRAPSPNDSNSPQSTHRPTGVVVGLVIVLFVIILIAVLLIAILYRRFKVNRVPISERIRRIDNNIETTEGQENPAYSLVGRIATAAAAAVDSPHHPHATNIYSADPSSSLQKPPAPNNDNDDMVLVDNDLYRHRPEQNFPNEGFLRRPTNENATAVYSLVQRTSMTPDDSFQPVYSTPSSSQQKPSSNGNNDTILVENDLYGCQPAQSSTYEMALRVDENEAVGKEQTTPSQYSLVQRVSTADDQNQPQATDTCSEKKPSEDGNDRILVENDLYNC